MRLQQKQQQHNNNNKYNNNYNKTKTNKQTNLSKHIHCYFQYIGIQTAHLYIISFFFQPWTETKCLDGIFVPNLRIGTRFGPDQVLGYVAGQVGPFQNFGANQMYSSLHLDRTRSEPGSEQICSCKQHITVCTFSKHYRRFKHFYLEKKKLPYWNCIV